MRSWWQDGEVFLFFFLLCFNFVRALVSICSDRTIAFFKVNAFCSEDESQDLGIVG